MKKILLGIFLSVVGFGFGTVANASENDGQHSPEVTTIEYTTTDTEPSIQPREIATFPTKWFWLNYKAVNGKPTPVHRKIWHVQYNKGWKFQGWLTWTGKYGQVGRFTTNFQYHGKLVYVKG